LSIETIWWEVTYGDGTTHSEARGAQYKDIDRTNLASFLLRDNEGPIVELTPDGQRTGHNLVYRRRVVSIQGFQPETVYVLGWIPQGPIFGIAPDSHEVWESPEWIVGDSVFYPPVPYLFERWTVDSRTRIVNPAYERID
jgi:hypothetical protein